MSDKPMTLQQFWDELEKHDWFFAFSDDQRVWREGRAKLTELRAICGQSAEHEALMTAFNEHHFSGKPWRTEQKPKPPRPDVTA